VSAYSKAANTGVAKMRLVAKAMTRVDAARQVKAIVDGVDVA
jgi:hypothetical protein